jgi:hypothetical protein
MTSTAIGQTTVIKLGATRVKTVNYKQVNTRAPNVVYDASKYDPPFTPDFSGPVMDLAVTAAKIRPGWMFELTLIGGPHKVR